jgi:uncharacterized membrane protein
MLFKDLWNFVVLGIIVILVDSLYLSSVSTFFGHIVQSIQSQKLKLDMTATVLCYLLIVVLLFSFVQYETHSLRYAFFLGACVYGIFELTNKAIFTKWPWSAVVIDTMWGGILFASSVGVYRAII